MIEIGTGELRVESASASLLAAATLSAATGRSFRWSGYRAKREPSGVRAAELALLGGVASLAGGAVLGDMPGDPSPGLAPGDAPAGERQLAIDPGAALWPVFRLAMLPVAASGVPSTIHVTGSTHGSGGETFEVTESGWCALLSTLGIDLTLTLERASFAPRDGGRVTARIAPAEARSWTPVTACARAELASVRIVSAGAAVPSHVQQRQAARARSGVQIAGCEPSVQLMKLPARSAGSVVAVTGRFGGFPVSFAAVSERGRSAESVGELAAAGFREYAKQPSVVPARFVDALLLFAACVRGRSMFTTPRLPASTVDVARLVEAFTGSRTRIVGRAGEPSRIEVDGEGLQT